MTKEEIVSYLQAREHTLWVLSLAFAEQFGDNDVKTQSAKARWCEYYNTLQDLGEECLNKAPF